jgi:hypothetical protein
MKKNKLVLWSPHSSKQDHFVVTGDEVMELRLPSTEFKLNGNSRDLCAIWVGSAL